MLTNVCEYRSTHYNSKHSGYSISYKKKKLINNGKINCYSVFYIVTILYSDLILETLWCHSMVTIRYHVLYQSVVIAIYKCCVRSLTIYAGFHYILQLFCISWIIKDCFTPYLMLTTYICISLTCTNFGQNNIRKWSSINSLVRYITFAYKELVCYTFIRNFGYKELFVMVQRSAL